MPGAAPKLPLRSRREKSRCPACCCRRQTKGIRISGGGAEPPACGGDRSDNPIKTGNHDDVFFLFYVKSKKRASLYELTTLILNEGSLLVLRTIMEAPLGRGLGLNPEWTLGGAACDWPPGGARSWAWALAHLSLVPLVEQGPQPITPAPEKRGTPSACLPGPSCSGPFQQAPHLSAEGPWCGLVGLQVSLRDPSLILRGHLASGRTICASG